jgi:hypothetical protein
MHTVIAFGMGGTGGSQQGDGDGGEELRGGHLDFLQLV